VNGTSNRNTYTATAGQTAFAATYDPGYVDAYLNGVKLIVGTDFTATNGTSIVLASGAAVGDTIDIVAYGTFVVADTYTKTQADARYLLDSEVTNLAQVKAFDETDYVSVTGDTVTGNLAFGDNNKAIFGAGSDLQIYHDGSNSYVQDSGTGILVLKANQLNVNSTTNASLATFVETGAASLYHNGSAKIATTSTGISVTGVVAATSFTGDGSGLTGVGFTTNVVTSSTTATKDNHYYLNGATLTLTLPASPSVGDEVRLSEVAGNTDCIVGRNGSNIMGDASDLTIDSAYLVLSLRYVDATIGWAFS
jgi:hypothetical protein